MLNRIRLLCFLGLAAFSSCLDGEQLIEAHADFSYTVLSDRFTVPVQVSIINTTSGASSYKWTFEGGTPASSDKKDPGTVVFNDAGSHKITLEAWNDDSKDTKQLSVSLDSAVSLAFDLHSLVNSYSPVELEIKNHTSGASSYKWTFEGGVPAVSSLAQPPHVLFTSPGEHKITLTVSNGRESFSLSKSLTVLPPLSVDFDIKPAAGDEDFEAPLTAILSSKAENALNYRWTASGGTILSAGSAETTVHFNEPGTYMVYFTADNGKESQTLSKAITVKPNTNLHSFTNVKLGINTAAGSIGSFFSTGLQRVVKAAEVNSTNGKQIDLVFFGLNTSFKYNKFVSPDQAQSLTFELIPGAQHTKFVNIPENCNCGLTVTADEFDRMTDDSVIKDLLISSAENTDSHFDNSGLPYLVFFQNAAGYKGIIKIKEFVSNGTTGSYILADIKVQKD